MGHEVPWGPVGVLVQDVSGPFLSKSSVPLRYEGSHPDGVPSLHRVPPFAEPVDALALEQEQAVLVVVDLFDVQELAGLKVHNVLKSYSSCSGRHFFSLKISPGVTKF